MGGRGARGTRRKNTIPAAQVEVRGGIDGALEAIMKKYICGVCGFIYNPAEGDPDNGVPPNTEFEDLPPDWVCPVCGAEKDEFASES